MAKDQLNVSDDVKTEKNIQTGSVKFVEVEVTTENGIFKNGKDHPKGSTLVLEEGSAKRFEELGEVKVLGEAEAPQEHLDALAKEEKANA